MGFTKGWFFLEYSLPVLLGLILATFYGSGRGVQYPEEKRSYYRLQMLTLVGAVVGGKISYLMGDLLWPWEPLHGWREVIFSGRSVVGALIGGFLTAEIAKPFFKYRSLPNDHFASILPFSIGIGRMGCWLAGCCRGIAYEGPFAISYDDDHIHRFPAQGLEIVFQLAVGLMFLNLSKRGVLRGRLFALYLLVYGVFRYFSEFARATLKNPEGISVYQNLSLLMIAIGAISLAWRSAKHSAPITQATAN